MRIPAVCMLLALLLGMTASGLFPQQRAHAQLESRTAAPEFADAYRLFANQLYRESIHAFAAFRQNHPDDLNAADALYYQAEASLAVGLEEEAVALFRRLEQDYPFHPLAAQSRLALGKFFFTSEQYDRAIEVLEQVVEDRPPPEAAARALYWMGESALNRNDPEQAILYFRRAADEYRQTETAPVALYTIGYTHVIQNEYDAAAEAFELLAARYPESSYARNIGLALAEIYYEMDDFQRTISEIDRRTPGLGPEARERATFLKAESYNQLRDSENAIVHYRRFTESSPESPYFRRALYGLAWNYYFEGVHEWAADHFARAREGHGDDLAARSTYYEAVNQRLNNNPEEAISLLELFVDRWPNHEIAPEAHFELAVGYYDRRRYREAGDVFTRLVERFPDHELAGEALYLRGNTSVAGGDFDDALVDFERAIEMDAAPAELRDEVRFQRAWLQYRNEHYEEAVRSFAELLEEAGRSERAGEALFWSAESHYQLEHFDEATRLFTRYLRTYPGGRHVDGAHYALGWTHFKQGQYSQAATEFNAFLESYRSSGGTEFVPYRTDALLRLADSYYALKRYPEAIRTYRQVTEQAGDYALYQIAQAFYNSGEAFDAISAFRNLIQQHPESEWIEEAHYSLGYIFFQNQDYDQAIAEYRQLIESFPRDPLAARAQYGIGDALFNAGQADEAIQAYRVVLERYPNSPLVADAAAGMQYALLSAGDQSAASRAIDEFITANPNSPVVDELRFRQAEVNYQSGRTEEAIRQLQRFIDTSQNDQLLGQAYYYMGSIYAERGNSDQAISYLSTIADRYSSSDRFPDAALRLGQVYLDEDRPRDALALYRRLESAIGNNDRLVAQARYGQAVALIELSRNEEAESLLESAVRVAPDAPETLPIFLGLARVYANSGRYDEADRLYRQVADRSRDEVGAEALYRLGTLLVERGNARRAIEEFGRIPVLYTGFSDWVARGYLGQARAFAALGQNGDAVRTYDRVIEEFRGTPYARTAEQEKAAL